MRIDQALDVAVARMRAAGVPNPRLDAELLLTRALGVGRHHLLAHGEERLPADREQGFLELVDRRCSREPLQYIVGVQEFWSIAFPVGPGLLVPRPETELLVEVALGEIGTAGGNCRIVDLGSGSGNISVVLAKESSTARIVAVDVSPVACRATAAAAAMHGVADRISVVRGDLLDAFAANGEFGLVVSNPPYIGEDEFRELQPEVGEFEPITALKSGTDGLDVIRRLVVDAPGHLRPGGSLIFEAGSGQAAAIASLAGRSPGWSGYEMHRDLAGLPRVHHLKRSR
jgi:release factor glutamine methyltransferase